MHTLTLQLPPNSVVYQNTPGHTFENVPYPYESDIEVAYTSTLFNGVAIFNIATTKTLTIVVSVKNDVATIAAQTHHEFVNQRQYSLHYTPDVVTVITHQVIATLEKFIIQGNFNDCTVSGEVTRQIREVISFITATK